VRDVEVNRDGRTVRLGQLSVAWDDGRRDVHRDDEIVLEALLVHLEPALARIPFRESPVRDSKVIPLPRRQEPRE
jgi:hypothetical protein